ncbi:FecR domain-containing protein [Aurantimonas sp. VKM B-3413]|uniref:FecR domain-containing protein n=1 Tax=Aurantimonas sp. VKM B-3413 TaxID=2779401 RepID=UPI001E4A8B84|nr:FecR domain-containing protein [Aurantimonas sp. VKM B-3413]
MPRNAPAAGSVISTRLGEEIEFVETPQWRGLEVLQDVKSGDVIRTNPSGQIAILFSDQTQIRVGRNSTLVVKERVANGDTRLVLQSGQIFARAARGGTGVYVETAAATAAIRGTDWTMRVDGDRTSLTVLDGAVEFSNPQGSLTVRQGEAAAATLGSAPQKIVIVASDLREQMLVNLSLREVLSEFPTLLIRNAEVQRQRQRLETIAPAMRSAEDRVLAAEIAIDRDGREAAIAALAEARRAKLTVSQDARLTRIEAMIAGSAGRYDEAVRLFEKALPHLQGEQRTATAYQIYFSRSLAEPQHAIAPPRPEQENRMSVIGEAVTAAFLQSPKEAVALMKRAEPRFHDSALYQSLLSQLAFAASDFRTAETAMQRAMALEPDSPYALAARATYRANVVWDSAGALADIEAALKLAPGDADLWNELGLIQSDRGADREAEFALKRAIALDPEDPVAKANYAIMLLDQGRVAEARAVVEAAFAADPSFEIGYFARGREQILSGDDDKALESFLRATTANPAFANGLLALGVAHAARGEIDLAKQAFGNADRIDPNDPVTAQYRAALAIDQYEADEAIRFAQESVKRTRARGGDYASIQSTREYGSVLGSVYRFLSLDAWGRYWSDVVFDPFDSGGYFDQAITGSAPQILVDRADQVPNVETEANATVFSLLARGLLLDPMSLASSDLRPAFVQTPFTEATLTGGASFMDGDWGGIGGASFQSLGYDPLPYSLLASVDIDFRSPHYADQMERTLTATLGFGFQPTAYDRIVGFGVGNWGIGDLAVEPQSETYFDRAENRSFTGFVGWSHTFAYHNVLNAAVFGAIGRSSTDAERTDPIFGVFPASYSNDGDVDHLKLSVAHTVGWGPLTLDYGGEFGRTWQTATQSVVADVFGEPSVLLDETATTRSDVGRAWIDGLYEVSPSLKFEGAVFATRSNVPGDEETHFDPRVGAAIMPVDGQWLRAAFLRQRPGEDSDTLAPVGVVGLRANALPQGTDRVDTAILHWDSEWTPFLFSAVDYQHQDVRGLSLAVPTYIDTVDISEATLDRLAFTANLWIGGGLGASATVARTWSSGNEAGTEGALPFVPDYTGRLALTYVDPSRLRLTAAETYLGERSSNIDGVRLDAAFVTDVFGGWETPDRRLAVDFGVYNVFDEAVEAAPLVPIAQRTVRATFTARF